MSLRVSRLWIHPVKSCRGVAVTQAELDTFGFAGDRRFLVTDRAGRFLTQRTVPAMARIATALDAISLTLSAETHGAVRVPLAAPDAPNVTVEVWRDEGLQAEHCGAAAADWLSDVLRQRVQLVRLGPAFQRRVADTADDSVSFADAYPLLIVSEGSLDQLNDRLLARGGEPVPMDRFRPNIVIAGAAAHAEDTWTRVRIGESVVRGATLCARCVMTTTDQLTGARGVEPLRTLASYRRDPHAPQEVNFGRNAVHETKRGVIRVGDTVEVLE